MSRKRNSLSQSISSLAASIPDIPVQVVGDHVGEPDEMILPLIAPTIGDHTDHADPPPIPSESPLDLFTAWSRTPEGHRVRDSRVPTDPVRLGCILDDNARIAFMAGYAAANPSFE